MGVNSRSPVAFDNAHAASETITKPLLVGNEWGMLASRGPAGEKEKRPNLLSR